MPIRLCNETGWRERATHRGKCHTHRKTYERERSARRRRANDKRSAD